VEGEPAARASRRGPSSWSLSQRSPTLGGTIPLRAAQACSPLLAGNAFGSALRPPRPIRLRRSWRALEVEPKPRAVSVLRGGEALVTFDTGLFVRPAEGVVLVLERPYNRRDRRVSVPEVALAAPADLHLTLRVRIARGEEVVLDGELASLGAFAPAPRPALVPLAEARSVGRAHLDFFDRSYFEAKRGKPTRKYRAIASEREGARGPGAAPLDPRIRVILAGDPPPAITISEEGLMAMVIRLPLGARAAFHGARVEARIDEGARQTRARHIEAAWGEVFGDEASPDTGAIRYFTTYVTAHAAGDPRLFFKPALLLWTPPGWRAVIDGPFGPGYDVLRGVTDPSFFHALPGVIELSDAEVMLRPGTPLIRVRPVPERLAAAPIACD
jgi:hypothetical protein